MLDDIPVTSQLAHFPTEITRRLFYKVCNYLSAYLNSYFICRSLHFNLSIPNISKYMLILFLFIFPVPPPASMRRCQYSI